MNKGYTCKQGAGCAHQISVSAHPVLYGMIGSYLRSFLAASMMNHRCIVSTYKRARAQETRLGEAMQ